MEKMKIGKIIDKLVCPYCHSVLKYKVFKDNSVKKKRKCLLCQKCHREYPILKNIPRFVMEEKLSHKEKKTIKNFGFEWKKWKKLPSFAENSFWNIVKIKPDFFKDKTILDAGCGSGRFLPSLLSKIGKRGMVIGVDISSSVEIAQEKINQAKNIYLFQADLYHLPIRKGIFDIIYCIGVLQHLSNPKKAISELASYLRPGGFFIGTFYSKPTYLSMRLFVSLVIFLRKLLKHLPLTFVLYLSRGLAILTLLLYIKPFVYLKQFFRYFKEVYSRYPQSRHIRPSLSYLTHIWFDQLSAPITGFYTPAEVALWFKSSGLKPKFPKWFGLVYGVKK